jgi:predicted TIM-barrel fold metal-dependent hydrolase
MTIVDTHVHYTQPPSAERPYALPAGGVTPITPEAVIAAARAIGIDRVVQVTPSPLGFDNRHSFEGAQQHPEAVAGVIGRLDAFAPRLHERLRAFMQQPGAVGVRYTLHHAWAADWLQTRKLDPLFAAAQEQRVPVFLHAPDQCEQLDRVAREFPGLRLVVDHTALRHGAGRDVSTNFAQWRELIALAKRPNVWMKVSYFPEAAAESEPYPYPTAQRRFRELFEAVGAGRMMWGSNFPVVTHLCAYEQALEFVRSACDFLGAADRDAILGGNFLRAFAPAATRDQPTRGHPPWASD